MDHKYLVIAGIAAAVALVVVALHVRGKLPDAISRPTPARP